MQNAAAHAAAAPPMTPKIKAPLLSSPEEALSEEGDAPSDEVVLGALALVVAIANVEPVVPLTDATPASNAALLEASWVAAAQALVHLTAETLAVKTTGKMPLRRATDVVEVTLHPDCQARDDKSHRPSVRPYADSQMDLASAV